MMRRHAAALLIALPALGADMTASEYMDRVREVAQEAMDEAMVNTEFLEKHETLFLDVTANCGGNFAKPAAENPDDPVLQERWDRVSRNCERLVEGLDDVLPWW